MRGESSNAPSINDAPQRLLDFTRRLRKAGATADISGLDIPTACVTPCVVQAKRNADITVTINKEGYESQTIALTKDIPGSGAAGFAGNLLLGGVVGISVDAVTGAALDHKPNPVIVTLQPLAPAPARPARPRPPRKPPPEQPQA